MVEMTGEDHDEEFLPLIEVLYQKLLDGE